MTGSGATTDVRAITINKGTSNANILELSPTNFTVQGVTTDVAGYLTLTNGTFKISGNFANTNRTFTAAAYTIGATAGFWLNNPNYTVAGQNSSPTTGGLLRISQGTFNIGTSTGNSMGFLTGSNIIVEGGAVNATGRFGVAAAGNAITYNQTNGTITVCTVGNASTTLASFDLGTAIGSSISITGGTIINQLNSTAASGPRDYRNQAGSVGTFGVTGGTVQLGNAASGAAKAFSIAGVLPNLVIDNTSAGHLATFLAPAFFNNITRNITINTGTTLNIGNNVFLMNGTTLTNNGTLTANGASSNFVWFLTTSPQTYTGSGSVTAPMTNFAMQANQGLTIDPASTNIIVGAIRIFSGSITNANKITLGNGGATTGIVQIGNTTTPTAAGNFDVPMTFNLGSGGQTISYLRTTAPRTTGPEVNPTRILTSMTYDDNDPTHALTIAGGDLTLSSTATALTLANGRVITGASILGIASGTATVTRTNGYVDGNLRKNFPAAASKTFEVGTANGFSPVTVVVNGGAPADVTAKAVQGPQPNFASPQYALQKYWTLTAPAAVSADLTFQYLLADVSGIEANYQVFKYTGSFTNPAPQSVDTLNHRGIVQAQSDFTGDWTVAQPNAPTAAPARLAGRITTTPGVALGGVTVTLNGNQTARTITDGNGNYHFDNVETENFYVVTPGLANYSFTPSSRAFSLLGSRSDATFTAVPEARTVNPVSGGDFFVRQQYLDFLGREPDREGWLYWTNQIAVCGANEACVRQRRIDVSAAFFDSEEFQQTGSFIYRLYKAGLGRRLSYVEFSDERLRLVAGSDLEQDKYEFTNAFVERPEFLNRYQNVTTAEGFVDALLDTVLQSTGVDLSAKRELLLASYARGGDTNRSRSLTLKEVVDEATVKDSEYNPAFVLMEYFGYLRRDPEADGYAFWLDVLNNREPENYRGMVCSFITSSEYQRRFSSVVSHSNRDCGQ